MYASHINDNLQQKGARLGAPFFLAAAIVVAAAVAEQQDQNDDPPPVVIAKAHTIVAAHNRYLRFDF